MLGKRAHEIYGQISLAEINKMLIEFAGELGIKVELRQSNSEGQLVDWIQETGGSFDGVIINPGAYSHYSIAIRDALEILKIPVIEVHLSNIFAREEFRQKSIISPMATGIICGLGHHGYLLALQALRSLNKKGG